MLSSLRKWVQDVTIDLTPLPPPPPSRSSPMTSSLHQHESRFSTNSAVYISEPTSMESVRSTLYIPQPSVSLADVDLSHLNREEQEHIAHVLRRARAAEEQQQSTLLPVTISSILSPVASSSSPSSSTSTNSFASDKLEKYDNEIENEPSRTYETILPTIEQCQTSSKENDTIDYNIENTNTLINEQPISITQMLLNYDEENDRSYDNIPSIEQAFELNMEENGQLFQTKNLTEVDENAFLYEESSPYVSNHKDEQQDLPSYQIDEDIDEDEQDERDHVKELEKTIENLSRHFPSEQIQFNSSSSISPRSNIDTDSILEMEIESPSTDDLYSYPLSLSVSIPIPINNHRNILSRSSGVRENLTDLVIPTISKTSSSSYSKRMSSVTRYKRNLPSAPDFLPLNELQLRRANSESRFTLPSVPKSLIHPQQNLDDESDLLEIDLNDPLGSMHRTLLMSKLEYELQSSTENRGHQRSTSRNFSSNVKQSRDQTTNTPPMSNINTKKKLKKKTSSSPINNAPPIISPTTKLQKSTSTEITYPFPTTKLLLNPSRHGISTDLGFHITGGHSNPYCMDVTACIESINSHHRNYEILKNIVQEGDEVLELGGVSLRGKSALFVENLMNTIQNEFEIIVRSQTVQIPSRSLLTTDANIQRRHSMVVGNSLQDQLTNNTVTKSKSTSIYSLQQKIPSTTMNISKEEQQKSPSTKMLTSNEEAPALFSHRHRLSLLPNDPGLNGAGSNPCIERQNSNESDESDSLSQYFQSSQSRTSSVGTTGDASISPGRSQSINVIHAAHNLQNFLRSDNKRALRASTSTERKSSLGFATLKFLKKKTKSVDFPSQRKTTVNQLQEHDYVGDIEIQIGHDSEREQLVLRIIQAKNVLPKDTNGFSDPFVKIYLLPGRDQENKRRTKHISKTLNPKWNQTVIYGHMHREELQYKKLEVTVWDYDRFKANDFLGQVTVDLKNPNVIDDKPHWYRLQALRSREETTNRGSSPRLFKMMSTDSTASSMVTINKNSVNIPSRIATQK